ncbi:glycosyl transferase [Jeongeupia sp. HS-3]|uniref:glycosyltransferase family 4 protein n=1 Tax=Jeongeupia sp. HS-3 TaxID=1009682 RepID=UPI0018A5B7B5|nr:glycosyltransferase family 4 protein [Jeongeupia sp. HS-3]BCL76526.1 glycosyl transferase [Jeongeupia sp. HS-3]
MKTDRHVLFVANTAWSLYNFRAGVIKHWINLGARVTVVAPMDECAQLLIDMGCGFIDLRMSAKGVNPIEDACLVFRLMRIYRRSKPTLIVHYTIKPNIYGSIAAKLAQIPSLAVTTGLGYAFVNPGVVSKIACSLYKFAFRYPREVWFLNEDDRLIFLERHLVSADRAMLLDGEGIDLCQYSPRDKPCDDGKLRFLLIARLLWDKGIGEFVEAARIVRQRYPNAIFQLLGACGVDNPSAINAEKIQEWRDEGVIDYLGTTTDVREFIAQADCIVLPSYREGVPRSLMEGASMEKALIATDVPGCRDIVEHEKTGFLCPVKSAEALAESIMLYIQLSPAAKVEMGKAGRKFMQVRFDEQITIAAYDSFMARNLA